MRRFGREGNVADWDAWKINENATACFGKDGFDFGIYQTVVNLTTHKSILTRYVYSLFWGFQVSLYDSIRFRLYLYGLASSQDTFFMAVCVKVMWYNTMQSLE